MSNQTELFDHLADYPELGLASKIGPGASPDVDRNWLQDFARGQLGQGSLEKTDFPTLQPGSIGGVKLRRTAEFPDLVRRTRIGRRRSFSRSELRLSENGQRESLLGSIVGGDNAQGEPKATVHQMSRKRSRRKGSDTSPGGDWYVRNRGLLMGAVALASIVAVGLLVVVSPWLSLETVKISADDPGIGAIARMKVAGFVGTPLLRLDEKVIEKSLNAVPQIQTVEIHKQWPDAVNIRITKRVVIAQSSSAEGRWDQLDAAGVVVSSSPQAMSGLPKLVASTALGNPQTSALSIVASLDPQSRAALTRVDQSGNYFVLFFGTTRALYGDPTDMSAKSEAISRLLSSGMLRKGTPLDLTVPDAVIVG